MRRVRRRVATACIVLVGLAGCGRCSSPSVAGDGGVDGGPFAITPLPPPAAWTFAPVRKDFDVAVPERCSTRAPDVRAPVALTTRFVAEARTLGSLAIADGVDAPPHLLGAAALTLDPAGESRDPKAIPWLVPSSAPRLGRTAAGLWVGTRCERTFSHEFYVEARAVWEMLEFLLNGLVFILIGFQLPVILQNLGGSRPLDDLIVATAILSVAVIVARIVWVFPGPICRAGSTA